MQSDGRLLALPVLPVSSSCSPHPVCPLLVVIPFLSSSWASDSLGKVLFTGFHNSHTCIYSKGDQKLCMLTPACSGPVPPAPSRQDSQTVGSMGPPVSTPNLLQPQRAHPSPAAERLTSCCWSPMWFKLAGPALPCACTATSAFPPGSSRTPFTLIPGAFLNPRRYPNKSYCFPRSSARKPNILSCTGSFLCLELQFSNIRPRENNFNIVRLLWKIEI